VSTPVCDQDSTHVLAPTLQRTPLVLGGIGSIFDRPISPSYARIMRLPSGFQTCVDSPRYRGARVSLQQEL
jgi:hypothetical protein